MAMQDLTLISVRKSFFAEFKRNRKTTTDVIDNTIEQLIWKQVARGPLPGIPLFGLDTFVEGALERAFGKVTVGFGAVKPGFLARAGGWVAKGLLTEAAWQVGIAAGSVINATSEVRGREIRRKLRQQFIKDSRALGICDC